MRLWVECTVQHVECAYILKLAKLDVHLSFHRIFQNLLGFTLMNRTIVRIEPTSPLPLSLSVQSILGDYDNPYYPSFSNQSEILY